MYLKRNIYNSLLKWKNEDSHSTLEITGARQTDKTYIINKFADENYNHKIYINLFEQSGQQFMKCYKQATEWTPGTKRPESPLHDAFQLYDIDFKDSEDTVIIIDEIQESAEIYNRIREFTRQFHAHFIVTGSYPGKIYDADFRYSSGDVTSMPIYTLSFEEFLLAYDEGLYTEYTLLSLLSLETPSHNDIYKRLEDAFKIYCQIGGYPKVVTTYLETKNMEKAQGTLIQIIETFTNESIRYFTDILDTRIFTQIFLSICRILIRESMGLKENSISEELQKLVTRDYSSNISKVTCNQAISLLSFSGILGLCGKITEMDILDFKPACRCYFMDLGLTYYYLTLTGADSETLSGTLHENFVFINLKKRQDFPAEIAFESPAFATFKGGEIDFVAQSIKGTQPRYLIEVKAGKNIARTARKALQQGKANRLLYLKGNTKGGVDGKVQTLPIYLLERYQF